MTFWLKFIRALTPTHAYLAFLNEQGHESFGYFVKLALLTGFCWWLVIVGPLRTNVALFFEHLAQKAPAFTIRDGKVFTSSPRPMVADLPFNSKLIVDTTGKTSLPPLGYWVSILITQDQVLFQARGWLSRRPLGWFHSWVVGSPLPKGEVSIDASFWRQGGRLWVGRVTTISLLLLLLYTLMTKFLHYVLMSGFAMALDAIWRLDLEYRQMLNLCIYALTPVCLLSFFFPLAEWHFQLPYGTGVALYYVFYGAFVAIAMGQVKKAQQQV